MKTLADDGSLPLHWAAAKCKSEEILKLMIDEYEEAVTVIDNTNKVPLHWACASNNLVAAIILATTWPEALSIRNKDGRIPFEVLGDGFKVKMRAEDKEKFIKLTLHACIVSHCSKNVHDYGIFQVSFFVCY